ncbi:uncharacterized protein [Pyxicephalus adspersus]|uniref:uncharacterized protein n=1 Tax=Pyxicephalus adspersus TaxID=30357 RepID=UPI003B5B29FC
MEGECNWTGVNDNTPKNDSPPDPFVAVRHLAFLHLEATSDHSSDEDTKFDTEEDDPSFFTGDTLFILEEVDPDTENSQFVLCPMIPYRVEASQNIKDSRQDKNGDQEPQDLPSCRINCHTSNVNHHYCMWHGSKYCCRASEPKWDVKGTIEKELYDDCLNYLECSDVMTDYTNGIWLSALLGDESVLLLETDQDDETKVSQDCRNECDVLSSGLTCLNEGSSNTLAMDDLASLCVSHSKAPEVEKGDLLKALETEMVITVEHQQDNTSSPKRKERCKLPCASAAIQDDQAGIEVENSSKEVQTASTKHSNPFMELYLVKAFTKAMTSLITMTDESVPHSLICDGPGEKEQGVEKLILEEDVIDKESPANHTEQEAHQLSEEEIQDQFTLEITKLHDGGQSQIQDQQFMGAVECSKIALKQGNIKCPCTTEGTEGEYIKEDDHTKLIRFLKANIQTPNELNLIENTEEEKDKDIHELGDSQKSPAEPENQDGNDSFEKDGEYIQKNDNIKNEKSPASGLPVSIKISDTNEIKEHESEIPDNGLEMVNSESQTDDSEPKTLECVSHIVDSNFQKVNSHVDLCRVTFDDTNFIESTTDKQEVCKQGHEHEASNINNQEDDNKSDSKSMDNCALKANDLVDQPPREKNISDSKTIDNCRVKINDLTYQPPGEKNNSNSQTIDKCIVKMNFLTDQTPREKNNLHSQTIDNGRLKMNDLTNQTPGKKNNSNSQTIDKCIVKMNDLTDQPPGEKNNLNSQTIDKCRVKMNDRK